MESGSVKDFSAQKLKWREVFDVSIENIEMAAGFWLFRAECLKWPKVLKVFDRGTLGIFAERTEQDFTRNKWNAPGSNRSLREKREPENGDRMHTISTIKISKSR